MNINKQLKDFFISGLNGEEYIIRSKAVTLMYYLLIVLGVMVVIPIIFYFIFPKDFLLTLIATSLIILITMISLGLLKRGKYNAASDIMTGFFTLVAIAGQFSQLFSDASTSYTAYIFFWFVVIIQTTLFNRKAAIYIVSLIFLVGNVVYFSLVQDILDGKIFQLSEVGFVDSTFSLFVSFLLSILIKKITDDALLKAREESARNESQLQKIQELMFSMKSSMERLSTTSEGLLVISANISDNSNSQASSLEEIMATIEEISAGIDSITDRTGSQSADMATIEQKTAVAEVVTSLVNVNNSAQKNSDEAGSLLSEAEQAKNLSKELASSAG